MATPNLSAVVEALIFAADEPMSERRLLSVLREDGAQKDDSGANGEKGSRANQSAGSSPAGETVVGDGEVGAQALRQALAEIKDRCAERPYELVELAGGFRFMTRPQFARWIRSYKSKRAENRISRPALETLAIVAYKQPIVRSEIDAIRGVQTGPSLRTLMDRGLVKIVGRSEEIGRPVQYGTTERFLEYFGIRSLADLPQVGEL